MACTLRSIEEARPLLPSKPRNSSYRYISIPISVRPYIELMRLEKVRDSWGNGIPPKQAPPQPTGTILMFWPSAWGTTMAAYATDMPLEEYPSCLALCFIGAFILRSSACTVNDIFDKDMDAGVARTKNRPLPSGRMSTYAAIAFLLFQYAVGVSFFYYFLERTAFWVAMFQLFPLFAIYPLLKRVTYWPQAWLGYAMNFGFVTSWITPSKQTDYRLLVVAMSGYWCWTMLYDTVYACQDIKDDIKMGVRSTAILFGSWIRVLLVGCGVSFLVALAATGYLNHHGFVYYVLSVGGTTVHLLWQLFTVDLNVPQSCWQNFNSNGFLGLVVFSGILIDYLLTKHAFQLCMLTCVLT